eukprot:SAG11_NODE_3487_length_2417_cov_1.462899_1_plen_217_part_00
MITSFSASYAVRTPCLCAARSTLPQHTHSTPHPRICEAKGRSCGCASHPFAAARPCPLLCPALCSALPCPAQSLMFQTLGTPTDDDILALCGGEAVSERMRAALSGACCAATVPRVPRLALAQQQPPCAQMTVWLHRAALKPIAPSPLRRKYPSSPDVRCSRSRPGSPFSLAPALPPALPPCGCHGGSFIGRRRYTGAVGCLATRYRLRSTFSKGC